MTEKLKTLMHERASLPEFEMPDVDLLVRDGSRRARRRGLAVAGGGAAAATAAVLLVVTALSGGPAGDPDPAVSTDPISVDLPSYAKGSVIHDAEGTAEVGHVVNAYVRTSVGYVVADPNGEVWSVAGGQVSRVGQTDAKYPQLVSDTEGSLAGWVDRSGGRPAFVAFDQSSGETFRNDEATGPDMGALADETDPAYFYAIDGRTAYWRDQRGAVAVDLDTGKTSVVDAGARNGFDLVGVGSGVIATPAGDRGTALRGAGRDLVLRNVYTSEARFSPDARWVALDADEPTIFDARTAEQVAIDLDVWFGTGIEWLDDDTVVMLTAEAEDAPVDLVTCQVPSGACEVAVGSLATFEELANGYALPVGGRGAESDAESTPVQTPVQTPVRRRFRRRFRRWPARSPWGRSSRATSPAAARPGRPRPRARPLRPPARPSGRRSRPRPPRPAPGWRRARRGR